MRKLLLLVVLLCTAGMIKAQEIYFQTGKNFTNYDFTADGTEGLLLQAGTGNFYELGYAMKLGNDKLKYSLGINLSEYNALGDDEVNYFSWNTQYIGLNNSLSFAVLNLGGFEAAVSGGVSLATLLYGKQNFNGMTMDLMSQKEFSGLLLSPKLGLQLSYNVDNDIVLSLGYAYTKSMNVTNSTEEKLSFNSQQIKFGVHFNYY